MTEKRSSVQWQAIDLFGKVWEDYKGRKYLKTPKDWGAVNTLLEYQLGPDDYIGLIREYLGNAKWAEYGNHSFHVFVYNVNNLRPIEAKKKVKAVIRQILCPDCQTPHNPDNLCPRCYPELTGGREEAIKLINELTNRMGSKNE